MIRAPHISNPAAPASGAKPRLRTQLARSDVRKIRDLVALTGYFTSEEVDVAEELAQENLKRGDESGYSFVILERGDEILGYACFGRIAGTDVSYDLYWIAVTPSEQSKGHGGYMLSAVVEKIEAAGGGKLYADTSSTDRYTPTRAFYERAGFKKVAFLEDFYRNGDGKVIYEKQIGSGGGR